MRERENEKVLQRERENERMREREKTRGLSLGN